MSQSPVTGCPIRKSAGERVFAPNRGLSQLVTSFFASESQGILHVPFSPFLVSFQESRLFHVDDIFPCHRFYVGQHCLSLCGESLFSSVLFFDIAICFDLLVNLLVTRYVLFSSLTESSFRNFYFHHVNVLFF